MEWFLQRSDAFQVNFSPISPWLAAWISPRAASSLPGRDWFRSSLSKELQVATWRARNPQTPKLLKLKIKYFGVIVPHQKWAGGTYSSHTVPELESEWSDASLLLCHSASQHDVALLLSVEDLEQRYLAYVGQKEELLRKGKGSKIWTKRGKLRVPKWYSRSILFILHPECIDGFTTGDWWPGPSKVLDLVCKRIPSTKAATSWCLCATSLCNFSWGTMGGQAWPVFVWVQHENDG